MIIFLLTMFLFPEDGVLVLRNGKTLKYQDSYKVDGNVVVFKNTKGDLLRLPLSLVDLVKSEERAAEKRAAPVVVKKKDPEDNLSDFERFVVNAEQTEEGEEGGSVILVEGSPEPIGTQVENKVGDLVDMVEKVTTDDSCSKLRKALVIAKGGIARMERRLKDEAKTNANDTENMTTLQNKLKIAKEAIEAIGKKIENCGK